MAMTKPAGVFLQIVAGMLIIYGILMAATKGFDHAWWQLGIGIVLLYLGGKASTRKS